MGSVSERLLLVIQDKDRGLTTGHRNTEAISNHTRRVWWRGGAKVPLEYFPKRMGEKKLYTNFKSFTVKEEKKGCGSWLKGGSGPKCLFLRWEKLTVSFYDPRDYPSKRGGGE